MQQHPKRSDDSVCKGVLTFSQSSADGTYFTHSFTDLSRSSVCFILTELAFCKTKY